MKKHMHAPGVKCPYCNSIANVGHDAMNCRSCGAMAVHQGSGIYKWHSKGTGTMDSLIKQYSW